MPERITVICPECAASLSASLEKAGRHLRCPKCRSFILVQFVATNPAPKELDNIELHSLGKAADVAFSGSQPSQTIRTARWTSKRIVVIGAGVLTFAMIVAMLISVGHPTPKSTSLNRQSMANSIKSIEDEAREDPEFVNGLSMANKHLIIQIRTLAIVSDFQFEQAYLGHCDDELTTVAFDRPEADYFIDARVKNDRSTNGFLYPAASDMCMEIPSDRSKWRPGNHVTADMDAAKDAFRQGGLTAALLMEPNPSKQGALKSSVTTLLNSPEVDRLLESALRGEEVMMTFRCGSLDCQISNVFFVKITFRRPKD